MAAFLRTIAGFIPWTDVVKAAPSIISAARGAFDRTGPVEVNADRITPDTAPDEALELIREDVSLLRTLVTELQAGGALKSRRIAELADENARLTDAVLELRGRFRFAVILALLSLAGTAAALWMAVR